MASQPGKQTNAIHILLNISINKDRQKIKFGQLIEYDMRNIFLKSHAQNVEKLVPDSLLVCLLTRLWRHRDVLFFYMNIKPDNVKKRKELFSWNKKHFSSFLNGVSLKEIQFFFGRWELDFKYKRHASQPAFTCSEVQ